MTKFGLARRWQRSAAFMIAGMLASGVLGLSQAAQQTPNPQEPSPQQSPNPQQSPGQQSPGQPSPGQPNGAPPNQQGPGQQTPGQQTPVQQPTNSPPGQLPGQQPNQPSGNQPLPVTSQNPPTSDHTILFPPTVHFPSALPQQKPLGFRLPQPGTGDITNQPNPQLPLFGWKFFEAAREVIDSRRAYYAGFGGAGYMGQGQNSGMPPSGLLSGTYPTGTPPFGYQQNANPYPGYVNGIPYSANQNGNSLPGSYQGAQGATPYPGYQNGSPYPQGANPYPGYPIGSSYPSGQGWNPYPGSQNGTSVPGYQNGSPYPGNQNFGAYPGYQNGRPYPANQNQGAYPGYQNGIPFPGYQNLGAYPGYQNGNPYAGYQNGSPYLGYPNGPFYNSTGWSYPPGSSLLPNNPFGQFPYPTPGATTPQVQLNSLLPPYQQGWTGPQGGQMPQGLPYQPGQVQGQTGQGQTSGLVPPGQFPNGASQGGQASGPNVQGQTTNPGQAGGPTAQGSQVQSGAQQTGSSQPVSTQGTPGATTPNQSNIPQQGQYPTNGAPQSYPQTGPLPQIPSPNFPGSGAAGSYPGGSYPGGSSLGGSYQGGSFPGGSFPGGGLSGDLSNLGFQSQGTSFGNRVLDPSHNILTPDEQARYPVSMPAPERYQLGPGDVLQITIQSPTFEVRSYSAEVDNQGRILVPIIGKPMVVRGLTLASLEAALKTQIRPALTNASVIVTLAELRTVSIAILGESYAPGTYLLPPTVTLFNALYASGGPTIDGSMRNIVLRRANGFTKTFDLYKEFVTGDASEDVPLEPGDILYIPPADSRVMVMGEVRRPATYEIRTGEHLKDAIKFAGGALPTGIEQKVAIESIRPGSERILVDASLVGLQNSNPLVYAGDTIDLYSIRNEVMNAVTVDGAVQTPRDYAMSSGMTVADLIESARGLTRDAYPQRADLFRENPDKTEKLIKVDLQAALSKDPAANIKLKPFDHLIVYTYDEVRSLGNRSVTVTGAVQRPGTFYRADNMAVRDVLLEAGGLQLNAYMDTAFIQRTNRDGTPGDLVKVNLNKLLSGDPTENVPLHDLDVLTVQTVQEGNYVADDQVQVIGAVQRPGVFTRGANMKVSDLIKLAGGTLPNAYTNRAFVQSIELDGRVGPLTIVDLKDLLNGDTGSDVPLHTKDTLFVYTKDQAQYQAPQVVTIHGAVQNPGAYSKAPGLRLKDILMLAGGTLPEASTKVEIAKARVPDGTPIKIYDLKKVLAGDLAANVEIEDGDMVSVPADSTIMMTPLVVRILGEVQNPGSYLVTSRTSHLSDLIKRAGGLKENAFPQGAQFFRDTTKLTAQPAGTLTPHIVALLQQIATDEYNRALARGDVDKIRAVIQAQAAAEGTPISISTSGATSTVPTASGASVTQVSKSRDPVTPARPLSPGDLQVLGNLNVDVSKALAKPHGSDDVVMIDGDSVTIPEKPVNVQIIGAVIAPAALVYKPGMTLANYLQNVGGLTADAAKDEILIIRESGNVRHATPTTKLFLGDVVFVPTKVMADRLRDHQAEFSSAVNTITSAGILLAVIRALTK